MPFGALSMSFSPRLALALVLGLAALPIAAAQEPKNEAPSWIEAGPMIGHTADTETTLWLQCRKTGTLRVQFESPSKKAPGESSFLVPESLRFTVLLMNLSPDTEYFIRLSLDGVPLEGPPIRVKTLPVPGPESKIRLGFGSCAHEGRFPRQPVYDSIAREKLDAFLFLGDNWYYSDKDAEKPADMLNRALRTRRIPEVQSFMRTTPCYAIWDDHDYGPNDSDKNYPLKEESLELFKSLWANPYYGTKEVPGVFFAVKLGPVEVFMLDDRYHRDPNKAKDGPLKSMWGKAQRDWLITRLKASEARFKLVVTGGQVLARYHFFESHQQYKFEREELLNALVRERIEGVVFLSGDRHLSEVTKIPAEKGRGVLYDFTCSPLANRSWPEGDSLPSEHRQFFYGKGNNYAVIEVEGEVLQVIYKNEAGEEVGRIKVLASEIRLPEAKGAKLY